eukprot:scaffold34309_cov27-Tisochrysis_lutea.AAC.3
MLSSLKIVLSTSSSQKKRATYRRHMVRVSSAAVLRARRALTVSPRCDGHVRVASRLLAHLFCGGRQVTTNPPQDRCVLCADVYDMVVVQWPQSRLAVPACTGQKMERSIGCWITR